jgi:hypothetical protein
VAQGGTGAGLQSGAINVLDYIQIMAYDGGDGATHSPYSYAVSSLDYWMGTRGVPGSKIILGVPFYARPSWAGYNVLLAAGCSSQSDTCFYNGATSYYNGQPTIAAKRDHARNRGARGIMAWEASQDVTGGLSLTRTMAGGPIGGSTPTATTPPQPTPTPAPGTLLSQGRPATASSVENASYPASNAVDGNTATRWSSAWSDPQWISVDLGATASITRVQISWEAAYSTSYQIQVSSNNGTWTTVQNVTGGNGGVDSYNLGTSGRWVRVYGTARGTAWGHSIFELQVYGTAGSATPTTPPRATPTTPPRSTPTSAPTPGEISTTAWYSLVNQTSSKCVDRRANGTANGTAVQQYTCNGGYAQQWQFQPTSGGYYRLNARTSPTQVLDVGGGSGATGDNAPVHLWQYLSGTNQQWLPQSMGNGYYRLIARHSGKCLDVPGSSTADSIQLIQYACNGTGAQSFRLVQQP